MGQGKDDPDFESIDNPEMVMGALGEYVTNASAYEDSTNVFVPFYRQSSMRYAGEIREKTGTIDAAISRMPYDDISAALDYFFEKYFIEKLGFTLLHTPWFTG